MKALIIGSGIAGIASAIRLAVKGYDVTVFEKNTVTGGKAGLLKAGDYSFDSGPSLFTHPQYLEDLFAFAGVQLKNYLSYKKLDVTCNYFYSDGTFVSGFAQVQKLAKELEEKLHEPSANVIKYLEQSAKLYNAAGKLFLENSLHKSGTLLNPGITKALRGFHLSHIFSSLNSYNKQQFKQPKTLKLFNRFATYNGSDPYKAPAMLSMIPHFEFNEGVYYPSGGMISIVKAMQRLAEDKHVKFRIKQPVQKIIVHHEKALGVVVNNENVLGDVIVSNADPYYTYKNLLGDQRKANKIIKQQRSSSAVIFYWAIDTNSIALGLHNIFFAENYEAEFQNIFSKKSPYHDPTIYINITAKEEPAVHAPIHKENWFVMVNAPVN